MRNAECGMRSERQAQQKPFRPSSLVPRFSRGFTLLEVLLSMVILAVIMTVIYASFSTASNNIERAEQVRDETDVVRTLLARLSADIANAYTRQGGNTAIFFMKKEEVIGELGKANEKIRHDSINLTTLTNWPRPNTKETELWEVGYFFKEKPDGKGYMLFRREKRILSKDVPVLEGGDEYELTDRIESLQFRYLENTTWKDDTWDSRSRMGAVPKAVEIVLTLDTGKVYATRVDTGNS